MCERPFQLIRVHVFDFLWLGTVIEPYHFIFDRINWIDWIYCFIGFQPPARRDETDKKQSRFQREQQPKNQVVVFVVLCTPPHQRTWFSPFSCLPRGAGERGKEHPGDHVNPVSIKKGTKLAG